MRVVVCYNSKIVINLSNTYMKELKKSSDLYIAITHYLTAGFALPLVIHFIWGYIVSSVSLGGNIIVLGYVLTAIFASWAGTVYSVRYLKKTYVINPGNKIFRYSSALFIIPVVYFIQSSWVAGELLWFTLLLNLTQVAAAFIVFSIVTKKRLSV